MKVALLLVIIDNKVLLFKRNSKESDNSGKYGLVGGGIEDGETPEQAIRREVKEEAGVTAPTFRKLRTYNIDGVEIHVFYTNEFNVGGIKLNAEHTEHKFFPYSELSSSKIISTNKIFVDDYNKIVDDEKKLNETVCRMKSIMGINELTVYRGIGNNMQYDDQHNENVLSEALTNVEDDVDLIFNTYLKDDFDKLHRTGIMTPSMFQLKMSNTSILKNDLSVKAHAVHPCVIYINDPNYPTNHYNPFENKIAVGLGKPAVAYVREFHGNLEDAAQDLHGFEARRFRQEFTEARIKGTIHHELAHWIDDSLNNNHIQKYLTKQQQRQAGEGNKTNKTNKPINTLAIERQAQIHNIKQVYNQNKDIWDGMSFEDLVDMIPAFTFVRRLPANLKTQWEKDIKMRMYREGLLGKQMFN